MSYREQNFSFLTLIFFMHFKYIVLALLKYVVKQRFSIPPINLKKSFVNRVLLNYFKNELGAIKSTLLG